MENQPPYIAPDPTTQLVQTFGSLIQILLAIVVIAGMWKIFEKAGQKGWKALIPIYNLYIEIKIVNRPGWWLLLLFVPLVNLVINIIIAIDLGKLFGKGTLFSVILLAFFPFVGYPILGFGSSQFISQKPQNTPQQPPQTQITQPQQPPTVVPSQS